MHRLYSQVVSCARNSWVRSPGNSGPGAFGIDFPYDPGAEADAFATVGAVVGARALARRGQAVAAALNAEVGSDSGRQELVAGKLQ